MRYRYNLRVTKWTGFAKDWERIEGATSLAKAYTVLDEFIAVAGLDKVTNARATFSDLAKPGTQELKFTVGNVVILANKS